MFFLVSMSAGRSDRSVFMRSGPDRGWGWWGDVSISDPMTLRLFVTRVKRTIASLPGSMVPDDSYTQTWRGQSKVSTEYSIPVLRKKVWFRIGIALSDFSIWFWKLAGQFGSHSGFSYLSAAGQLMFFSPEVPPWCGSTSQMGPRPPGGRSQSVDNSDPNDRHGHWTGLCFF